MKKMINIGESPGIRRIKRICKGTLLGILIGIVSGLGGIFFNFLISVFDHLFTGELIRYFSPNRDPNFNLFDFPYNRWMMLWIPALGGLISGFIVFKFAPEAQGHGTDAMIESFHRKKGLVKKHVPLIKTIASAITIGSGGSAGKEGPIAQIGSGFGSILASILKLNDKERRIMLLAGAAGGIGAIFKAPLGAALFTAEVLYSKTDFEFEAIIPCVLSSIVGYTVFTLHDGAGVIFQIPYIALATPIQLPFYGLLGIICAFVGFIYLKVFYGTRDRFFNTLNIPNILKPALGGLMMGVVAFFLPEVLSGGYKWIQSAINNELSIKLMGILVLGKILATSFTISSGGSGGVFAPSLFIGSMLGGFFGNVCAKFFPNIIDNSAAFVLVGMGGFFAGVAKTPIASLIMVAEMTGGYYLILPMMIVSSISFLLLGKTSLYEKQVPMRINSPAHMGDYVFDVLEILSVKDAIPKDRKVDIIPEGMHFKDVLKNIIDSHQEDFPVVDKNNNLIGIISMTDLRAAMADDSLYKLLVAKDLAVTDIITVNTEDSIKTALEIMASLDIREIPVVKKDDPTKVISMVSRKDILRVYQEKTSKIEKSQP